MLVQYRVTTVTDKIAKICKLGIKHHLYTKYGLMQEMYTRPHDITCASIAYIDEKPVGICLKGKRIDEYKEYDISVYVGKRYRRKGIGTALVKKSNSVYKAKKAAWYSNYEFFKAVGMVY